jgi:imidazolonepropionase-like amidohydrolase
MEAYRALFARKIPALIQAERTVDIRAAVEIFHGEFKLRCILAGGGDAFRQPELLVDNSIPLLVGPQLVRKVETEQVNLAQVIATRGGRVGFGSGAGSGVKQLPLAVMYAVSKGLGVNDALAGMTAWPAEMLSLEDQIGTLAPGRDADLVVLSGPPFELSSRVLAVMIDGQWVYEAEEFE